MYGEVSCKVNHSDKIKVDIAHWDSLKNPHGFFTWIGHFGSVVRSSDAGRELESFLDDKLERINYATNFALSFITDDPDFHFELDEESDLKTDLKPIFERMGEEEGEMYSPFKEAKGLMKDPPRASHLLPKVGEKLSNAAIRLDRHLSNVLQSKVLGPKQGLFKQVKGSPYVQAVAIFWRHTDASGSDRKT